MLSSRGPESPTAEEGWHAPLLQAPYTGALACEVEPQNSLCWDTDPTLHNCRGLFTAGSAPC